MIEDWSVEQARRDAHTMCQHAGIVFRDLELLHFGERSVFRIQGSPYVLRILRPGFDFDEEKLRREISFAHALAQLNIHALQPVNLAVPQPLRADGSLGTFWYWVEAEPNVRPTLRQFGHLLKDFHQRTQLLDVELPLFQPLLNVQVRLRNIAPLYDEADITLLINWSNCLTEDLLKVSSCFPLGILHGDAHPGNALVANDTFIWHDFEEVSWGPREWDLIPAALSTLRLGLPERDYCDFCQAYGFDVTTWEGFTTLRRVRELNMTTWLMQLRTHSRQIEEEIALQLMCWRSNDERAKWQRF